VAAQSAAQPWRGGLLAASKDEMDGDSQRDVSQVLEEIRARLQRETAGVLQKPERSSPAAPSEALDLRGLHDLLAALQTAQHQLGSINPRPPGFVNNLLQSLKRGIRKLIAWYLRPVAQYQSVATQFLTEAIRILEQQQNQLRSLEEKIEALRTELDQLRVSTQPKRSVAASNPDRPERDEP